MQQFAVYPAGAQGWALLALRAAAIMPLAQDIVQPAPPHGLACAIALAIPLALGGFTRVAALLCAAWALVPAFAGHPVDFEMPWRVLEAGALVILGPGAFSLDARLFGRRVIRFPAPPKE